MKTAPKQLRIIIIITKVLI